MRTDRNCYTDFWSATKVYLIEICALTGTQMPGCFLANLVYLIEICALTGTAQTGRGKAHQVYLIEICALTGTTTNLG